VPLEYAAAAGHIECWKIAKPLLQEVAQRGFTTTMKAAADEFSRMQRSNVTRPRPVVQLSRPLYRVRA
jgi:hypothetical protein